LREFSRIDFESASIRVIRVSSVFLRVIREGVPGFRYQGLLNAPRKDVYLILSSRPLVSIGSNSREIRRHSFLAAAS
jgi:hypothetical protein